LFRTGSIEWLHSKLANHIQLIRSYTEYPYIDDIIKICRLKPYDYIFNVNNWFFNNLTAHKKWIDEYGNSLIIKKKNISIIYNDLSIDRQRIICTDIYHGLLIKNVAKISSMMHLVTGKDEDLYQDCYLLTFLGLDRHLRSYLYWYGEWQQISPLYLGLEALSELLNYQDKHFYQLPLNKNYILPCVGEERWLGSMAGQHILAFVKEKHEEIFKIL
jgi:hypothetical protein